MMMMGAIECGAERTAPGGHPAADCHPVLVSRVVHLKQPFVLQGQELHIGLSGGLALVMYSVGPAMLGEFTPSSQRGGRPASW